MTRTACLKIGHKVEGLSDIDDRRAVPVDDEARAQTLRGDWSAPNHEQKQMGLG